MSAPSRRLTAPAKLTVSLRVTGVRADGLHLIDAEMVALDLHDVVEIVDDAAAAETDVEVEGLPPLPPGENLVAKALRVAGRPTARIRLHKAIPAGAGLGGGSSDAAAVLRWVGFDDVVAAAAVGADVAFSLVGGRAQVTGMGEEVVPLPFVERTYTLVTPPFGCPTPEVYAAWDRLGGPTGDWGNDLEPAALEVRPELAAYRDGLAAVSGQRPRLAGSGATWFVEGAYPGDGRVVTRTVEPDWIAPGCDA